MLTFANHTWRPLPKSSRCATKNGMIVSQQLRIFKNKNRMFTTHMAYKACRPQGSCFETMGDLAEEPQHACGVVQRLLPRYSPSREVAVYTGCCTSSLDLVGGFKHWFDFSHHKLGIWEWNVIIPTDFHSLTPWFFRGLGPKQSTSDDARDSTSPPIHKPSEKRGGPGRPQRFPPFPKSQLPTASLLDLSWGNEYSST